MTLTRAGSHEHRRDDRVRTVAGHAPHAPRRWLLQAVCTLPALPLTARAATIDTLKVVIGAQVGALYDLTGRSLGAAMIAAGQAQSAIYDNKSGAAGLSALLDFASDEHGNPAALMVVGSKMIGAIDAGEPLAALRRVTPIARLSSNTMALVVRADSPIRQLADLVLRLQAQPAAITWGGGHRGSMEHVLAGLLARAIRVAPGRLNYVPFSGGQDVAAALRGGHVQVGIGLVDDLLPAVRAGTLRALAATSADDEAGIPCLRRQGIDLEVGHWRGVFAPTGLDDGTRAELIDAVRKATDALSWKQALARNGWSSAPLFGDAFGEFVQAELRRFDGVLQQMGVPRPRVGAFAPQAAASRMTVEVA